MEWLTPQLIELAQAIGIPVVVVLMFVAYMKDRGKADSNTETTLAQIASTASSQIIDVHKTLGDMRQELGHAQGQVKTLKELLETERIAWNLERGGMNNKLSELSNLVSIQTKTLDRNAAQIDDLQTRLEAQGIELKARDEKIQKLQLEIQDKDAQIMQLGKQLLAQGQIVDLDATILLPDDVLPDTKELPPIIPLESKEEPKDKIA